MNYDRLCSIWELCDAWPFILILVHIVNSQKSFNYNKNHNGNETNEINQTLPTIFLFFLWFAWVVSFWVFCGALVGCIYLGSRLNFTLFVFCGLCGYKFNGCYGSITIRSKLNNNWFLFGGNFLGFSIDEWLANAVNYGGLWIWWILGGVFQFLSFLFMRCIFIWLPLGHISNIMAKKIQ